MKKYRYEFLTACRFSPAVCRHSFKLRVQPMHSVCQTVVSSRVELTPACCTRHATDAFGNSVLYGLVEAPHDCFLVASRGEVVCHPHALPDPQPPEFYRYATALTACHNDLRLWAAGRAPEQLMEAVHRHMHYERGCTTNATTAAEAFALRRGVCQDFAHVMLAACRAEGYLARYVNGMLAGEGETHAWVEVHLNGCWQGYDPTFNRPVGEGYIKLAHGRDTNDCAVNRGRFYNWTTEQLTVNCKVTYDTDSDLA